MKSQDPSIMSLVVNPTRATNPEASRDREFEESNPISSEGSTPKKRQEINVISGGDAVDTYNSAQSFTNRNHYKHALDVIKRQNPNLSEEELLEMYEYNIKTKRFNKINSKKRKAQVQAREKRMKDHKKS